VVYWIIYDISSNKRRKKVSDRCKDYGLKRVQKSAFLGILSRNKLEMLIEETRGSIDTETDCLFAIANCSTCYGARTILGEFDESACQIQEMLFVE